MRMHSGGIRKSVSQDGLEGNTEAGAYNCGKCKVPDLNDLAMVCDGFC